MASGLPWRALRPVLLAGAAAIAWFGLSTPAASADTGSDSGSLLGGISSPVSSLSGTVASVSDGIGSMTAQSPVTAPEPVPVPATAGPVQPVPGSVTGAADQLISAVPALGSIVAADTVTTAIAPVSTAAAAIGGLAEAVLPAAGDVLPVLDPVLEPVTDPATVSTPPLPVPFPGTGQILEPLLPDFSDPPREGSGGGPDPQVMTAAGPASSAALASAGNAAPMTWFALPSAGIDRSSLAPDGRDGTPDGGGSTGPEALPLTTGAGSGSGQFSGGPSGSAAWLSDLNLCRSLPGTVPVSGPLQHAPSPVSFDPGSSPD